MTLKKQWETIKENWLIAVAAVLIVGFLLLGNTVSNTLRNMPSYEPSYEMGEKLSVGGVDSSYYPGYDAGFAPEVEDRKITKEANLQTEIERGEFKAAEDRLKSIIASTDSYVLNENVYRSGEGRTSYLSGDYQIKVETGKYGAVISQLKELGEVQLFSENSYDITGQYDDIKKQLEAEQARLDRFKTMLDEAITVEEKIQLTDRIYELERTVKYLQEAMSNMDTRVDYSTIYFNMREEQSGYAGVALIGFSQLVAGLVESFNGVLSLLFMALPYLVLAIVAWLIVKFRKN